MENEKKKAKTQEMENSCRKDSSKGRRKERKKRLSGRNRKKIPERHLQPSFKAGAWHSMQEDGWVHDQAEPSPRVGHALASLPSAARLP